MKVTLPDGRLFKIEGGDAQSTARLLADYIGQGNVSPVANETPLEAPVMTFEPKAQSNGRRSAQPIQNVPAANESDEAPLELPAMAFSK